jgi:light-independent protochlorophyllide reductase subunit B
MKLTLWTYEGPPHVGAMRVATALEGVHYVLHAPQGDTYADLLFTMIERRKARPPVTYTTFQARDLGGDTAELFKTAARQAYARFQPELLLVGASCTAELIQDDPGGIAAALGLPVPVVPLELNAYQHKESWGASETLYRVIRAMAGPKVARPPLDGRRARANLLGPTALGFRHRDDVIELTRLLAQLGVDVHVVAPLGARPGDLARLGEADFNVVMYPELADTAARWLAKQYDQPTVRTVPIGVGATHDFIREVAALVGRDPSALLATETSRLPWYSRSIDSTYLTGKRCFVFGDATHALAAARIAKEELGFDVVGLGTYSREFARDFRTTAKDRYGLDALVSDDHIEIEARITELHPELVLGTQMERHIAKRLGVPCAVISAPVHVQDFPARYAPQMGFEGANVIFDTWVHPLMMGLEEHLLAMFRDDFEFHDGAGASHLGRGHRGVTAETTTNAALGPADGVSVASVPAATAPALMALPVVVPLAAEPVVIEPTPASDHEPLPPAGAERAPAGGPPAWTAEAERELKKIPFFVRGKAKRNTEQFAMARQVDRITVETLYDAKAHFSR